MAFQVSIHTGAFAVLLACIIHFNVSGLPRNFHNTQCFIRSRAYGGNYDYNKNVLAPSSHSTLWSSARSTDTASAGSLKRKLNTRFIAGSALFKQNKDEPEFSLQRLTAHPSFLALNDQRDRSFARLLVTTVERYMGQIDKVLEQCVENYPPKRRQRKRDAFVQCCLRVGAAQILFLRVPNHAALKETIDALKMDPGLKIPPGKVKFVNAVLRRIAREGQDLLTNYTRSEDNIALWLLQEWISSWGAENTKKIVKQLMKEPHTDLSIKYSSSGGSRDTELLESVRKEFGDGATLLPHGTMRVGSSVTGAVDKWPLYDEGLWWVQDASAALPALGLYNALAANGTSNVSGLNVVDCCAAPGGKTAQLVSMGFRHVTAVELTLRRSRQLVENLERLNMLDDGRCTVHVADATEWLPGEKENVSGVLLDVPCTATGTGSKRPDVLRREQDMGNLLELQERLATHVADSILGQGGIMIYATCSLLRSESEDQVHKLLSREPQDGVAALETVPFFPGEIPGFDDAIDENGWLRVLPGVLPGSLKSCDGFFVARLRKKNPL